MEKNRVHIHRRSDGAHVRSLTFSEIVSVADWHPDGLRIGVVWGDSISINDSSTGRQVALSGGHEASVVGMAFDRSGDWLVTSSWDRTTRFWRTDTMQEVNRLGVAGNHLRLSADGRHLAFQSWDHSKVHLFDLAETDVVHRFHVPGFRYTTRVVFHPTLPVERLLSSLTFNPEGNLLVLTGEAGWLEIWDLHQLRVQLTTLGLDWSGPPLLPVDRSAWRKFTISNGSQNIDEPNTLH